MSLLSLAYTSVCFSKLITNILCILIVLAMLLGLWDLSPPTRD